MTDDTTPPAPTEAPEDPNAPKRVTLPSGKVVEVRSHRTLLGTDVDAALGAQSGAGSWVRNVADVRAELIRRMVTEIEPGRGGAPALDGTREATLSQRADDYRKLYTLVDDAFLLVTGQSVIPDYDEWADPKAPTAANSGPSPDSEDDHQP